MISMETKQEVLRLLRNGCSKATIADRTGVSLRSVYYIANTGRKQLFRYKDLVFYHGMEYLRYLQLRECIEVATEIGIYAKKRAGGQRDFPAGRKSETDSEGHTE